jgi:hypothetical protein
VNGCGPPTNDRRPGLGTETANVVTAGDAVSTPTVNQRSDWPQRWQRVLERRHAQRELDALLGCDPYPDVEARVAAMTAAIQGLRERDAEEAA